MAKKNGDMTLAPSIGAGWDVWGAACGFTSWDAAANALGITRAQMITNRKKEPRKTIRLAMNAVLNERAGTPYVMLPERPSPALGRIDGTDAYTGVQMLAFGRACADAQHAVMTGLDPKVIALIDAAKSASATLGHAYHTTLSGELAEFAHSDYQRLDAAISLVEV